MQAIDFPSLAGLAMRRLGWSPDMFWAATPADMRMALGTGASQLRAALKPDELEALMQRFPDHPVDDKGPATP